MALAAAVVSLDGIYFNAAKSSTTGVSLPMIGDDRTFCRPGCYIGLHAASREQRFIVLMSSRTLCGHYLGAFYHIEPHGFY